MLVIGQSQKHAALLHVQTYTCLGSMYWLIYQFKAAYSVTMNIFQKKIYSF